MDMSDALTQVGRMNGTTGEYQLAGAAMIADAINRLAAAQERQAEIQEKQFELATGMMKKMTPMMDKTSQMMDREISDQEEGEEWKRGNKDDEEIG